MRYLLLIVLFILGACSSAHLDNQIHYGNAHYGGGYGPNGSWNDKLIFQRVTWFSGLNALYEVFATELSEKSPFFAWITPEKQVEVKNKCDSFVLTILHTDTASLLLSHGQFIEEMRGNGYREVLTPLLARSVKSHPDFEELHIPEARILGFCRGKSYKGEKMKEIRIRLLGFPEAIIDLH